MEMISKSFEETSSSKENDIDDPEPDEPANDAEVNVNCGVCGNTFSDIDDLEKHIGTAHTKKVPDTAKPALFVAKEGGWRCHLCGEVLRTSRELKAHKSRKQCSVLREADLSNGVARTEDTAASASLPPPPPPAAAAAAAKSRRTISSSSAWQQSESRNWAAEFGYNKNSDEEEEEEVEVRGKRGGSNSKSKSSQGSKPEKVKPKDILSAMKLNFGANNEEDSSDDGEVEESILRNKDGRAQRLQNREPRILSKASRQTRRRLELLTKQAQEKMKVREKSRAAKRKSAGKESQPGDSPAKRSVNNNQVVEVSSEEEDLNVDVSSSKDNLLIPLDNGWVCEKTRAADQESHTTHYWSPDGDHFTSLADIQRHAADNNLRINMEAFKAANIDVGGRGGGGAGEAGAGMSSVRVKDEETGLPMVIIFPGGRDCLTMDVSATA